MSVIAKMFCVLCIILCAACESGTTDKKDNGGKNYAKPEDKPIGNYFTIHKFVGEYDSIGRATAVEDTNHYLGLAKDYIQGLADGFRQPEKFQNLIGNLKSTTNYNVDGPDGAQKLDLIINSFKPCETIFKDIVSNLGLEYGDVGKRYREREAFEMCYEALANEAYYQAYGSSRNTVKNYYENKKAGLVADWFDNEFLYPASNLATAYEQDNFNKITSLTDSSLGKAATNMGVDKMDLRKVVNIALAGESLHAMHDLVDNLLDHKQERMVYNPVLEMQHQMNTLEKEDRNKYENMSLGR